MNFKLILGIGIPSLIIIITIILALSGSEFIVKPGQNNSRDCEEKNFYFLFFKFGGSSKCFCGDGILDSRELCDYVANDVINNPYGEECKSNCRVDGTPNGWRGCRGNGVSVCVEKVNESYFSQHPLCVKNHNCDGSYFSCNDIFCPAPFDYISSQPLGIVCTETDEGDNLYVKGTTTLKQNGKVVKDYSDICKNSVALNEWYCLNERRAIDKEVNCPDGCENSVCKDLHGEKPGYKWVIGPKSTQGCYISLEDINKSKYIKGSRIFNGEIEYDYCQGSGAVMEVACYSSYGYTQMNTYIQQCEEGEICEEGACVKV